MACCGAFEETVDQLFTSKKAGQELERYRRKGAGPTARLLIEGLSQAGMVEGTLLDVGAGVGALTFDLLDRGIRRALIVEASAGYAAAASDEAVRRGHTTHIELKRGDFLEVAQTIPNASVVTLGRVVCCSPLYEQLLSEALRHAERGFAFSYPRDRWYVRTGMKLENALRRHKTRFRTFVHPESRMRELIEDAGFELVSQRQTIIWSADVFVRCACTVIMEGPALLAALFLLAHSASPMRNEPRNALTRNLRLIGQDREADVFGHMGTYLSGETSVSPLVHRQELAEAIQPRDVSGTRRLQLNRAGVLELQRPV